MKTIILYLLILAVILVSIRMLVYRFEHPELTETQLFLDMANGKAWEF